MPARSGTGKTLLARAVANRTDACFIRVIGSELVQKYVGEGARMVRELFQVGFREPCSQIRQHRGCQCRLRHATVGMVCELVQVGFWEPCSQIRQHQGFQCRLRHATVGMVCELVQVGLTTNSGAKVGSIRGRARLNTGAG